MPLTSLEGVNVMDNHTYMQPRISEDIASVGYYQTSLENRVVAEMSASQHAGIMKYLYPEQGKRYVLLDISYYLPSKGKREQWYSNGLRERSQDGSWYSGYGVWREGWGGSLNLF